MGAQTLYESWLIRLRLLEPAASSTSGSRREEREILEALLAKYSGTPAAQRLARFPVEGAPVSNPKRFTFSLRRTFSLVRERMEAQAKERIEPVVHEIAQLDPQRDAVQFLRQQQAEPARLVVYGPRPRKKAPRKCRNGQSAVRAFLQLDLIEVLRTASARAAARVPELLFRDVTRLPAEFLRLGASYAQSMWRVFSHSDSRNAVDYVVEELEQQDVESNSVPGKVARPSSTAGVSPLFMDHRTILIHAYAREDSRDALRAAQRVLHPVCEAKPLPVVYGRAPEKGALDALIKRLREGDTDTTFAALNRELIESSRALDEFVERFDHRYLLTDDVIKAFYVNLAYVSKAMRLLTRHGLAADGRAQNSKTNVESDSREQLHDQVAELLRDPRLRARALQRFRLELADGASSVRFTAIGMIGRLGTLDDIGLLLDLAGLLPPGPRSRIERRALLSAARRIAENS